MNVETKKTKSSVAVPNETVQKHTTRSFNVGWGLMKGMVYFFGVVVVLVVCSAFIYSYQSQRTLLDNAYIVTNAGTVLANHISSTDLKSREVEVRNHVTLFFNKMYSFNEYNYKQNIEDALHLIGPEGKHILSGYNQANAYETLVKTSATVTVAVDSIWTDMDSNPYRVKAFVRQFFSTPTGSITKRLYSNLTIQELGTRSTENIHGLLINKFDLYDDEIIEQVNATNK